MATFQSYSQIRLVPRAEATARFRMVLVILDSIVDKDSSVKCTRQRHGPGQSRVGIAVHSNSRHPALCHSIGNRFGLRLYLPRNLTSSACFQRAEFIDP